MSEQIYVEPKPLKSSNVIMIIAGSALYAAAVNWFMKPLDLYAGGVVGLAQLIDTVFFARLTSVDIAGILNFALNVPLFLLAWKAMSKRMLIGTVISVAVQTVVFTVIRIPAAPLLDDKLACIIISGLIGGFGCGLVLTNGGSAGGLDLLGVYLTQKKTGFSVGTMNLVFNAVLYSICAYLFDLSVAIFSIIFVASFSLAVDKFHYQNIEVELMVFTHHPEAADVILHKYVRGVTEWDAIGAYTGQGTKVLLTVVDKSQVESVKKDILAVDPKAFIIAQQGTAVTGGYQKRLV